MNNISDKSRSSKYSHSIRPSSPTYPVSLKYRNVILLVGLLILLVGFCFLLWLAVRPKEPTKIPNGGVVNFEKNQETEFFYNQGNPAAE